MRSATMRGAAIRKAFATLLFLLFLSSAVAGSMLAPTPAFGQSEHPEAARQNDRCDSPPGEGIIWDVAITRPLGLLALTAGLGAALVSMPIALISHSEDRVAQSLIVEPYEYTFKRPLGTFNYDPCNPATGGGGGAPVPEPVQTPALPRE